MPRHNSGGHETEQYSYTTEAIALTIPEEAGITPVDPGSATGSVTLPGHETVTSVWEHLIRNPEIIDFAIVAAEKVALGSDDEDIDKLLDTLGITNAPRMGHMPRQEIPRLQWRPVAAEQSKRALFEMFIELGTGCSDIKHLLNVAKLLPFAHRHNPHLDADVGIPTITVEIDHEKFTSLRRDQRSNVCTLFKILSNAFDIRLSATRNTRVYLDQYHQHDLPCVSEWNITPLQEQGLKQSLRELQPSGTPVAILSALDDEPSGMLSYSEIYDIIPKSRSRVRQCLSELRDYNLVTTFGSPRNKKVTLREAGAEVSKIHNNDNEDDFLQI
jgi:hypothetical protein